MPLFIESDTEFVDFELYGNHNTENIKNILNNAIDPMAQIINIEKIDKSAKSLDIITQWAKYEISFLNKGISNFDNLMYIKNKLTSEDEIFLKKKTKKGVDKLLNIKNSIRDVQINDEKLFVTLKTGQNQDIPSVRADDLMKIFYSETKFNITRIALFDENMQIL